MVSQHNLEPAKCEVISPCKLTDFQRFVSSFPMQVFLTFDSGITIFLYSTGTANIKVYGSEGHLLANDFTIYSSNSFDFTSLRPNFYRRMTIDNIEIEPTPIDSLKRTYKFKFSNIHLSSVYTSDTNHGVYFSFINYGGSFDGSETCSTNPEYKNCAWDSEYRFRLELTFPLRSSTIPDLEIEINNLSFPPTNGPCFLRIQLYNLGTNSLFYIGISRTISYYSFKSPLTFTVETIHIYKGIENEYRFIIDAQVFDHLTLLLSIDFDGVTIPDIHKEEIDCVCNANANCYIYDDSVDRSIDIDFKEDVSQTEIHCYVPEFVNGMNQGDFIGSLKRKINRKIESESSIQTILFDDSTNPGSHSLSISFTQPPPYSSSEDYELKVETSIPMLVDEIVYLNFANVVPLYFTCDLLQITECRQYRVRKNVLVKKLSIATNTVFEDDVTILEKIVETPDNFTVFSLICDPTTKEIRSKSIQIYNEINNFGPTKTDVTLIADELSPKLHSLMSISFKTKTAVITATRANKGGLILVDISGPTSISTACSASYSRIHLLCTRVGTDFEIRSSHDIPIDSTIEIFFTGDNPDGQGSKSF